MDNVFYNFKISYNWHIKIELRGTNMYLVCMYELETL